MRSVLGGLVLVGCAHSRAPVEVRLQSQRIELETDREDVTVAGLSVAVRCIRRRGSAMCDAFSVDGVEQGFEQMDFALEPVGDEAFRLPETTIRFSDARGGYACVGVKAFLAEVDHQCDALVYEEPLDRYTLATYCTVEEHPGWAHARYFDHAMTNDLDAFEAWLAEGLVVRLDDGPLPEPTADGGCSVGE